MNSNDFIKNFKIVGNDNENVVNVSPFGCLLNSEPIRLCGTAFSGTVKDPNFWLETVTGSATVVQAGEILMSTLATADSTAQYQSIRKARYVGGMPNKFKTTLRLVTAPQLLNVRRWGCYDVNNGFFFQFTGLTFSIGYRKAGGADQLITDGNFNGLYGLYAGHNPLLMHSYSIIYTSDKVYFYIDNKLLHTLSVTLSTFTNTKDFNITIQNNNTGGNTTNNILEVLTANIVRFGSLITESKSYHLAGVAATHTLKVGAGKLHKIIFNNTSGTTLTIYDNVIAAAPVLAIITTTTECIGEWEYNIPFDTGLTLVTVGASLDATIIYE
jgi:hypothetical protein